MRRFLRTRYVATVLVCALSILLLPIPQVAAAPPPLDSIFDIQSTVDAYGASLYEYSQVTIQGLVSATHFEGYVVAEAPGAWSGIYVASYYERVRIGDEVRLTGWVFESNGMTVIASVSGFELLSSGNPVESMTVSVADASQEAYESVLLTVEDVEVYALLNYGEWVVTDVPPTAGLLCDDMSDYVYFPQVGDRLDTLTGVLAFTYRDFKLEPRFMNDITGDVIPHYALHGTVVTMNDARDVFFGGYVEKDPIRAAVQRSLRVAGGQCSLRRLQGTEVSDRELRRRGPRFCPIAEYPQVCRGARADCRYDLHAGTGCLRQPGLWAPGHRDQQHRALARQRLHLN